MPQPDPNAAPTPVNPTQPARNTLRPGIESPKAAITFHVRPATGRHRFALRAARAFCEALFSTKDGPPPKDRMDWLIGELDDYITCAGWRSGGVYKLGLVAITFLAPLFVRKPLPLWSLSVEERVLALTRMERSGLAVIVLGIRTIICITWYDHPDSQRDVGYTGGVHVGPNARTLLHPHENKVRS